MVATPTEQAANFSSLVTVIYMKNAFELISFRSSADCATAALVNQKPPVLGQIDAILSSQMTFPNSNFILLISNFLIVRLPFPPFPVYP
jgi:hypothetical protein